MTPPDDNLRRHLDPVAMPERVAAIILAAGFSSRMGRFKPLLPLGGEPALRRTVELCQAAGVGPVVVVTGHQAELLRPLVSALGATAVHNPAYEQEMYSSLRAGLAALPAGTRAFFLLPADMPLVRPACLRFLAQVWLESGAPQVHPSFLGKRGHPPLLDASLFAGLAAWPGQGGLKAYLETQAAPGLMVEVPDQGVRLDMDHPQDYQALELRWQRRAVPGPREIEALLGPVLAVPEKVRGHCRAVARVALALGRAALGAGLPLDLEALEAAALLHDLAKGQPDHAQAGARLLRFWGWDALAPAVAGHMDLPAPPAGPLGVAELLYLADKLVEGDRLVELEERFNAKLARHGGDPVLAQAIARRLNDALAARDRLQESCGRSLAEILAELEA